MGYKMTTNLLHRDPVDLQHYIEENHLALYASILSEKTQMEEHKVNTNYTH